MTQDLAQNNTLDFIRSIHIFLLIWIYKILFSYLLKLYHPSIPLRVIITRRKGEQRLGKVVVRFIQTARRNPL